MFKTQKPLIIIFILIFAVCTVLVWSATNPLNSLEKPMIRTQEHKYKEAQYVQAYCKGQVEYRLPDKTRVDCLTDEYAIEFDWAKKWAESIGQSLYYSKMTGKKPAVAIIMLKPEDERYIKRIEAVDKNITIFKIKAYE